MKELARGEPGRIRVLFAGPKSKRISRGCIVPVLFFSQTTNRKKRLNTGAFVPGKCSKLC